MEVLILKWEAFSVYDRKGMFYGRPFFARSGSEAMRSFLLACDDPGSLLHMAPDDFSLYSVGDFDDLSGVFVPLDHPAFLVTGFLGASKEAGSDGEKE